MHAGTWTPRHMDTHTQAHAHAGTSAHTIVHAHTHTHTQWTNMDIFAITKSHNCISVYSSHTNDPHTNNSQYLSADEPRMLMMGIRGILVKELDW